MADLFASGPDQVSVASDPAAFIRAVDEMSVGVLVYQGPDHVVIGANRVARQALGHRPGILGRSMREVAPELDGQQLLEQLDRTYATGRPHTGTEWRVILDGPESDVSGEIYINFTLTPLTGSDGRVSGLVGEFSAVTEAVLARRELEADTAELRERFEAAQDVVLALQRSLLPAGLPVLPGFRIAAHYLVASAEQAAGGDWFDAIPVGGRLVAVVGDVVGHGAQASAVMGQLRAVLEEFLVDGDDLAVALARLDRFATRVPGARGATVCLALLDPSDGSVSYACAGHPPPLVVCTDGATRLLPAPGGGPLGVSGPGVVVGHTRLRPGELLLCFSDGLFERPGTDPAVSLGELGKVASSALLRGSPSLRSAEPADRVAELTVERMIRDGHFDDVTLLVVRLTGQDSEEFVADLPAEPGQLAGLRDRLARWLGAAGAGAADIVAIEIAVLEAVTNAVEHAYDGPGGTVRVEGVIDERGQACMTVIDQGRWRPAEADPGRRGRGLMMIRGCMDTVEIDSSDQGTTLLLDRQLRRRPFVSPATPGPSAPTNAGPTAFAARVVASADPRLVLGGALDLHSVDELRRQLWSASRGGTLPLTVDLGQVTHLASAGVALLFDFAEEMTANGRKPRLVVPLGSPARHSVTLTGLDKVVTMTDG